MDYYNAQRHAIDVLQTLGLWVSFMHGYSLSAYNVFCQLYFAHFACVFHFSAVAESLFSK